MRALPYIAAALAGCATAAAGPDQAPAAPEQAFRNVKVVAFAHRLASGEDRRRDPLDALQAALEERGRGAVTLELVGRPPADLAAVDALVERVAAAADRAGGEAGPPDVASVGDRAAPVLDQLGADALAVYVRGVFWQAPPPSPFFERAPPPPPVATSAIALVARDGTVVVFSWGGGDPLGGAGLANAAEAVDAALALLAPVPAE